MKKVICLFFTFIFLLCNLSYAIEEEVLNSQQEALGISDFLDTSKQYTQDVLDTVDIQTIFKDALTGKVGNTNLWNHLLNLLGRETKDAISNIGIILTVIILHSI